MTVIIPQWLTGIPVVTGKLEDAENKKTNQRKRGAGSCPCSTASQFAAKNIYSTKKERKKMMDQEMGFHRPLLMGRISGYKDSDRGLMVAFRLRHSRLFLTLCPCLRYVVREPRGFAELLTAYEC